MIGTASSVLLEAMGRQRPVATLDFRGVPLFYATGWRIEAGTDLRETFSEMLGEDGDAMAAQTVSLRDNLASRDFYSICDEIREGKLLPHPRRFDADDDAFEWELQRASRVSSAFRGRGGEASQGKAVRG